MNNRTTICLLAGLMMAGAQSVEAGVYRQSKLAMRPMQTKETTDAFRTKYPLLSRQLPATPRSLGESRKSPAAGATAWLPGKIAKARSGAPVSLYGNVVYQNNWDSRYSGYGLYDILLAGDDLTFSLAIKGDSHSLNCNGGGVKAGDYFYACNWYEAWGMVEIELDVYDVRTGEWLDYNFWDEVGLIATEMAYDEERDIIYGAYYNDSGTGYELATVKYEYDEIWGYLAEKTPIGDIKNMVVALGVTKGGDIYGVAEDGCLYRYDSQTAEATLIGDTGIKVASSQGIRPMSGTIDQHNDTFYWACTDMNGVAALYTVDLNDAHVEKVADMPADERVYALCAMPHLANDMAPGVLGNFSAEFGNGALEGIVSFTAPDMTFSGDPLEGDLDWSVDVNGETVASGRVAPGGEVSAPISVMTGQTLIEAYVGNADGKSPVKSLDFWAGEDTPVMKSAGFTHVNDQATVTWAVEERGLHQGWLSEVVYDVVRMPEELTVEKGTKSTTFTETIPSDAPLNSYYYVITPANGKLKGEPMATNKIVIGESIRPPYIETFDSADNLEYFILGNGWRWDTRNVNSEDGAVRYEGNSSDEEEAVYEPGNNAWLLSPEIAVEAGRTYDVSFKSWSPFGEKFEVRYGVGNDPSKYSVALLDAVGGLDPKFTEIHSFAIEAPRSESIRIGIIARGRHETFMKLDDLKISAGKTHSAPGAVEAFVVTPAEYGQLSALASLTAPTVNALGDKLESLDRIELYEDTRLIATFENPVPGESLAYTFIPEKSGYYTFSAEAYNEDGVSEAVSQKVFIGIDLPLTPTSAMVENGNRVRMEWTPSDTGKNGEYVDQSDIYYAVFGTGADALIDYDPIIDGYQGTALDFDFNPQEGPQGILQLLLLAYSSEGTGDLRWSRGLMVGKPYALPFREGFTFDEDNDHVWIEEAGSDYFGVSTSHSSDGDGKSMGWGVYNDGVRECSLVSGKIDFGGNDEVTVRFDYIVNGGNEIRLYTIDRDGNETLAGTFKEESDGSNGDWKTAVVKVARPDDADYLRLRLMMVNNAGYGHFMHFDNLIVDAVPDHDLALKGSLVGDMLRVGEKAVMRLQIENTGNLTSDGGKVNIYHDGTLVDSREIPAIEAFGSSDMLYNYEITPAMTGSFTLAAEIDYDKDERDTNDLVEFRLEVAPPTVSAPANLTGTQDGTAVSLAWEAPTDFMTVNVTDDFESYNAFAISELGDWTLVDADGRKTTGLAEGNFDHNGDPMAFIVFNPQAIGVPEGNVEALPHSGRQYLVAFSTILDRPEDHNDDWLISPELSGNAQTISFHAKNMISRYGAEKFQVLYSMKGKAIEDFTLVAEHEVNSPQEWVRFEAELPEGAQYFAIRVITARGHMFMLDDISFERGSSRTITGYNVYRDAKRVAATAHNKLAFSDPIDGKAHDYNVSAVYVTGEESAFSNTFRSEATGVEGIEADTEYTVVTPDGITLQRKGSEIVGLPKGIYIVNGRKLSVK